MPLRLLRDGILTSEAVNSLDWEAEVFYRRLMSVVDDYGRYDARPSVLRSSLYPIKLDAMRESSVQRCLEKCEAARLLVLYCVSGKPYLELTKFGQKTRTKPKWPAPSAGDLSATCGQPADNLPTIADNLPTIARLGGDGDGDGDEFGDEFGNERATLPCFSPPDLKEVLAVMQSLAIATLTGKALDDCAAKFMNEMEASGWLNRYGVPLRSWQPKAKNWALSWVRNEAGHKGAPPKRKDSNDPEDYR